MDVESWHERWRDGRIGFHLERVNPYLVRYWDALDAAPEAGVFVPLCGKSLDLAWLAERGHRAVGVEVSEQAVRALFAESGATPEVSRSGAFKVFEHERVRVYCGDFFALQPGDLAGVEAVYDRASLIAIPRAHRPDYAAHLEALMRAVGARNALLITLEYPDHQMPGPPYSVPDAEVRELLGEAAAIDVLCEEDVLADHPRFRAKGLTGLVERAYRIRL